MVQGFETRDNTDVPVRALIETKVNKALNN